MTDGFLQFEKIITQFKNNTRKNGVHSFNLPIFNKISDQSDHIVHDSSGYCTIFICILHILNLFILIMVLTTTKTEIWMKFAKAEKNYFEQT